MTLKIYGLFVISAMTENTPADFFEHLFHFAEGVYRGAVPRKS